MRPLVSVCMGTAQVDRPLMHGTDTVYEILRRSVAQQTYKGAIEVIVADTDEERLTREHAATWGRATRVVLTKQVLHDRIAIAAARNTAAAYARGDLIVFVDDCTELLPSFIEAAVDLRAKLPTRMLLVCETPAIVGGTTRSVLRSKALEPFTLVDPLWRAQGSPIDSTLWKLSGQAGGVFVIGLDQFQQLNGFDENFDGNWGCEDQEFCARLDRLKVPRVSCCDLAVVQWVHRAAPLRAKLRRCRELYAQWTYRNKRFAANRRLSDADLRQLSAAPPCDPACILCTASDRALQIQSYRTYPADFDLRALRKIYAARPGGIYLDPWR